MASGAKTPPFETVAELLERLGGIAPQRVRLRPVPDQSVTFAEDDTLDGGEVLPGLALPLRRLFAEVPRGKRRPGARKRKQS